MANFGFTFWIIIIIVVAIGITLLVAAKGDTLASIAAMAFTILGSVWVGFYYAMLTGW